MWLRLAFCWSRKKILTGLWPITGNKGPWPYYRLEDRLVTCWDRRCPGPRLFVVRFRLFVVRCLQLDTICESSLKRKIKCLESSIPLSLICIVNGYCGEVMLRWKVGHFVQCLEGKFSWKFVSAPEVIDKLVSWISPSLSASPLSYSLILFT